MARIAGMHSLRLPLSPAILALMLGLLGCAAFATEPASASPDSAAPLVDRDLLLAFLAGKNNLTLIDARSSEEFTEQHINGAVNVPHDQLSEHQAALPADLDAPLVVYCRTGRRAGLLRTQLQELGYTDVQVLPPRQVFWGKEAMALNCGVTDQTETGSAYPIQPDATAKPERAAPASTITNSTRERG